MRAPPRGENAEWSREGRQKKVENLPQIDIDLLFAASDIILVLAAAK